MAFGDDLDLTVNVRAHDTEIIVTCVGMTECTVKRQTYGGSTSVRNMDNAEVTPSGLFYGVDAEVPNGTFTYVAIVGDGSSAPITSDPVPVTVDHGGDWLMPLGLSGDGRTVNVESLRQHSYDADREVVKVLGRRDPVAVHYGRHWFSGSLVLLTLDDGERLWLEEMLFTARIVVFAPRENAGYEQLLYLSVGDVTAERTSLLAREDSRRWTLDVQSVAAPPADYAVEAVGNTWDDVEFSGYTWNERRVSDTWRSLMGL